MSRQKSSWADQVEEAEEAEGPAQPPVKFESRDGWHEKMEVYRDQSKQRLDMQHGFMRDIVSATPRACDCPLPSEPVHSWFTMYMQPWATPTAFPALIGPCPQRAPLARGRQWQLHPQCQTWQLRAQARRQLPALPAAFQGPASQGC